MYTSNPFSANKENYPIAYQDGKTAYYHTDFSLDTIRTQLAGSQTLILPSYQNLPPLQVDLDTLPPDLASVISSYGTHFRIDRFAVLFGVLGGVNNALRGRYIVKLNEFWKEPLVDYWLLLAPPGSKKSAFVKALRSPHEKFLNEKQAEYHSRYSGLESKRDSKKRFYTSAIKYVSANQLNRYSSEMLESNPELVQQASENVAAFQEKISADLPVIPASPELFWDNGTMKGLLDQMANQGGCVGIMEAEGGFLLDALSKKNIALTTFLKAKDMEWASDIVIGRKAVVRAAALPMLFVVQPAVYEELYTKKHLSNRGGLARFLPYFIQNTSEENYGSPSSMHEVYSHKINKMLRENFTQESNREIHEIEVDKAAYNLICDFERAIDDEIRYCSNEAFISFLQKLHGSAVRIAGDIHCWNNPEAPHEVLLSEKEMMLGINIAQALKEHARLAFSPELLMRAKNAQEIARFILRRDLVWANYLTSTYLAQHIRDMDKADIIPALQLLEQSGMIRLIPRKKGAYNFIVNPNLPYMII